MNNSQRRHGLATSAEPLESGTRLPHVRASRRGKVGREDGAAAVEFAIVATLFFMLVFGIIDFGFAFHSWNNAANAAREGARKAAVTADTAAIAGADDRRGLHARPDEADGAGRSAAAAAPRSRRARQRQPGWRATSSASSSNYQYNMITPIGSFVPGLGSTLMLHSQSESRFEGQ